MESGREWSLPGGTGSERQKEKIVSEKEGKVINKFNL